MNTKKELLWSLRVGCGDFLDQICSSSQQEAPVPEILGLHSSYTPYREYTLNHITDPTIM